MVNTVPIPRHEMDHRTPIFDGLMADWGHTPGTLTPEQEEEMREYAAQLAADPNPIVKGFEPAVLTVTVGEIREQIPKPVAPVIVVGTLADKPQEEPQPVTPVLAIEAAPQEAAQEPEEAPEDPDAPELLPEAATVLLDRVVPAQGSAPDAETAVLPVAE